MKAIRLQFRGGPEALVFEEAPLPRLGEGELLVRVRAAAAAPTELENECERPFSSLSRTAHNLRR
jgi:NADPH:quinone reductase-like Zn-dependent oxidoreductase